MSADRANPISGFQVRREDGATAWHDGDRAADRANPRSGCLGERP